MIIIKINMVLSILLLGISLVCNNILAVSISFLSFSGWVNSYMVKKTYGENEE